MKKSVVQDSCVLAVVAAVGIFLVFHPTLMSGFQLLQTDQGDTRLNHYFLEHSYRWIRGDAFHSSLWDPPFFYPEKNVLAYADNLLGVAPVYWLFRAAGLHETGSFQVWAMLIVVLNFIAAYWFFRKGLGLGLPGSLAAAFLFAFSATRVNQLGHHQQQGHFYTPVFFLCVIRMLDEKISSRYFYGVAASVLAALQLYACFYLAWFLVLGCLTLLAFSLPFAESRTRLRRMILQHRPGVFVGIGICSMLIFPVVDRSYKVIVEAGGYYPLKATFQPAWQAWIYLGPNSWLYSWQAKMDLFAGMAAEHEQRLGIGLLTSLAGLVGFWWNRHERLARRLFWTAAALALVATCPPLWRLLFWFFPGAAAIRAVPRISLLLLLVAGLGVAWFFDGLVERLRGTGDATARILLIVAAGAVLLLEQGVTTRAFDWKVPQARVQQIQARIDPDCPVFLSLPVPGEYPEGPVPGNVVYQQDAMWASLRARVPTVNGRSGRRPPRWRLTIARPDRYAADIRRWKDRWPQLEGRVCYIGHQPGD